MTPDQNDDLTRWLAEQMRDPGFIRAWTVAQIKDVKDAYVRGRSETAATIAVEIRRELVCCTVYDEDADTERAGQRHAICFWGEAGARIAESVGRGDRD